MPQALRAADAARREQFAVQLEQIAEQAAEGEAPGSSWLALAALLRGEAASAVAPAYAARIAALPALKPPA